MNQRIIGQSARLANTYLVDLGDGWGSVYHDDLRYIEDPHSLESLQANDARWQPWMPAPDPETAAHLMERAFAAIRLAVPQRRELFQR